ncbi:hypothetical protein ACTFIZ_000940 [Dictyostelium cf. discoideum]
MGNIISFEFKFENMQAISYDYFQSLKKVEENKKDCYMLILLILVVNRAITIPVLLLIFGVNQHPKQLKSWLVLKLIFFNGEIKKLTMETRIISYLIDKLGLAWPESLSYLPIERVNIKQLVQL